MTAEAPVSVRLCIKPNPLSFSLYVPHPPPDFGVSEVRSMRQRTPNILAIAVHFLVRTCALGPGSATRFLTVLLHFTRRGHFSYAFKITRSCPYVCRRMPTPICSCPYA